MIHPSLVERITRSLAYMLRHKPEEFDLELDRYGYADLVEVVQALNERLGEPVEEEDVVAAIEAGDRPRYEIRDGRIGALYGHSIPVDPGAPAKPPEFLYVGIGARDAERATRFGLQSGRRRFLHLALTEDEALEMGKRLDHDYTVLTVHALDAWEEGSVEFYDRRSVFLSEPIPREYLSVGETHHDGEPREEGSPRGERRAHGERGRSHEERRGGGEGGRSEGGDRGRRRRGGRGRRRGDGEGGSERREPAYAGRERERTEERPIPRVEQGERPPRVERPERFEVGASAERSERSERVGRPESFERRERPDRPERGGRDDRFERRDRPERSSRPERPEREARPESPPSALPREPAPSRPGPAPRVEEPSSSFGLGIFEPPKRPAPPPAPVAPPEPRREAPPPSPPRPQPPPGPDFGAGI